VLNDIAYPYLHTHKPFGCCHVALLVLMQQGVGGLLVNGARRGAVACSVWLSGCKEFTRHSPCKPNPPLLRGGAWVGLMGGWWGRVWACREVIPVAGVDPVPVDGTIPTEIGLLTNIQRL
jgi:hypothetical protein